MSARNSFDARLVNEYKALYARGVSAFVIVHLRQIEETLRKRGWTDEQIEQIIEGPGDAVVEEALWFRK